MSTATNPRPTDDVDALLDVSAETTQRSELSLAADFSREIEAAVSEADAGDFASDAEVAALAKKWKLNQTR